MGFRDLRCNVRNTFLPRWYILAVNFVGERNYNFTGLHLLHLRRTLGELYNTDGAAPPWWMIESISNTEIQRGRQRLHSASIRWHHFTKIVNFRRFYFRFLDILSFLLRTWCNFSHTLGCEKTIAESDLLGALKRAGKEWLESQRWDVLVDSKSFQALFSISLAQHKYALILHIIVYATLTDWNLR